MGTGERKRKGGMIGGEERRGRKNGGKRNRVNRGMREKKQIE